MSHYLEEYDVFMDYYKQVCMDEALGVMHAPNDLPECVEDEVFVDPASPVKCRNCQDQRRRGEGYRDATPSLSPLPKVLGKPPKPSKPLKSSKSFLGGLRKSRSAEALQSLRVNVMPKSPSAVETKEKSKSRLRFLAKFKRMVTKSDQDPLKSQASCTSLSPSVGSMDSGHSSDGRRLSGAVSFRVGNGRFETGSETCKDCEAIRRRFTSIEDQYGDLTEEERESGIYKYQSIRR